MMSVQCLPALLLLAVVCATADVSPPTAAETSVAPTRHHDASRQPENLTAVSGRTGRFLNLLSPPPPPPPAATYYPSSGSAFDDFSGGGDQVAVYDYTKMRNDLDNFLITLGAPFALMISVLYLSLPLLLPPLLVTLAGPWLPDTLVAH